MKGIFVESREFTEWIVEHLPDDAYAEFQRDLGIGPKQLPEISEFG